jgi:hypothetical protein
MSVERELLKKCVQHLLNVKYSNDSAIKRLDDLLANISVELANPEPEPVAWLIITDNGSEFLQSDKTPNEFLKNCGIEKQIPLYTSPLARKALGYDEIRKLRTKTIGEKNPLTITEFKMIARAVEKAMHGNDL